MMLFKTRVPCRNDLLLKGFCSILLVIWLLLLRSPYLGIWHDSVLYAGQALADIDPQAFGHDVFFRYGSQAAFTLFPELVAPLVKGMGLGPAFFLLTLVGLLAFCVGSWWLAVRLLPATLAFYGLVALLLLPSAYGADGIFHYLEPFLTGRLLAEPLVLVALAGFFSKRFIVAGAALISACALHPLQALPAVAVLMVVIAGSNRRRWLAGLLACVGLLCVVAIRPGIELLQWMDPIWKAQIAERSPFIFISGADAGYGYYLMCDFFVVGLGVRYASGDLRRCLLAVLFTAAFLLFVSLLLVDLMSLVWPARLQLWRAQWLLHWTAVVTLPWLARSIWSSVAWPRFLLFAVTIFLGFLPGLGHPLLPGGMLLYIAWPWLERHLDLGRWILLVVVLAAALLVGMERIFALLPSPAGVPLLFWLSRLADSLLPVLAVLLLPVGIWMWRRLGRPSRLLMLALLMLATGSTAAGWDRRTGAQLGFTGVIAPSLPFGVKMSPEEQVFWVGGVLPVWSVLRRPSYISSAQMAGVVFSREASMEAFRRKDLLHTIDGKGRDCSLVTIGDRAGENCMPDAQALRGLCEQAGGELSYVVVPYALPLKSVGVWQAPQGGGRYTMHSCVEIIEVPMQGALQRGDSFQ
ncbi:hypothetical protein [Stenotrophomonas sp.]|uniref:hypothetical protein n=1 Tax=Stenotrophomonas sp. TaxID=69392 RepID=UPI0028AF76FD|nr:hypothetical protein [Stenotrophomonas sp.]